METLPPHASSHTQHIYVNEPSSIPQLKILVERSQKHLQDEFFVLHFVPANVDDVISSFYENNAKNPNIFKKNHFVETFSEEKLMKQQLWLKKRQHNEESVNEVLVDFLLSSSCH